MWNDKPVCLRCGKEIQGDEVVIRMRYPKRKGFTEIKAYLQNEGEIICAPCNNRPEDQTDVRAFRSNLRKTIYSYGKMVQRNAERMKRNGKV